MPHYVTNIRTPAASFQLLSLKEITVVCNLRDGITYHSHKRNTLPTLDMLQPFITFIFFEYFINFILNFTLSLKDLFILHH